MKSIRTKTILTAILFLLIGGILVYTIEEAKISHITSRHMQEFKKEYELFELDQIITSVSDHVSVVIISCDQDAHCDRSELNKYMKNALEDRKKFEEKKKQMIISNPFLVSEQERKLWVEKK